MLSCVHKTVLTARGATSAHNGMPNAPYIPFHIPQWHQANLGFQGNTKGDALHHCVLMRPAFHSKQCVYGPHGMESTHPCVFGSDSHMSPPVMASQTQTSTILRIIRGYVVMCAQNSVNSKQVN